MTKKAFQSFAKQVDSGILVVQEDDVFDDDHPYVVAWPEMFGELADMVRVRPADDPVAVAVPPARRRLFRGGN